MKTSITSKQMKAMVNNLDIENNYCDSGITDYEIINNCNARTYPYAIGPILDIETIKKLHRNRTKNIENLNKHVSTSVNLTNDSKIYSTKTSSIPNNTQPFSSERVQASLNIDDKSTKSKYTFKPTCKIGFDNITLSTANNNRQKFNEITNKNNRTTKIANNICTCKRSKTNRLPAIRNTNKIHTIEVSRDSIVGTNDSNINNTNNKNSLHNESNYTQLGNTKSNVPQNSHCNCSNSATTTNIINITITGVTQDVKINTTHCEECEDKLAIDSSITSYNFSMPSRLFDLILLLYGKGMNGSESRFGTINNGLDKSNIISNKTARIKKLTNNLQQLINNINGNKSYFPQNKTEDLSNLFNTSINNILPYLTVTMTSPSTQNTNSLQINDHTLSKTMKLKFNDTELIISFEEFLLQNLMTPTTEIQTICPSFTYYLMQSNNLDRMIADELQKKPNGSKIYLDKPKNDFNNSPLPIFWMVTANPIMKKKLDVIDSSMLKPFLPLKSDCNRLINSFYMVNPNKYPEKSLQPKALRLMNNNFYDENSIKKNYGKTDARDNNTLLGPYDQKHFFDFLKSMNDKILKKFNLKQSDKFGYTNYILPYTGNTFTIPIEWPKNIKKNLHKIEKRYYKKLNKDIVSNIRGNSSRQTFIVNKKQHKQKLRNKLLPDKLFNNDRIKNHNSNRSYLNNSNKSEQYLPIYLNITKLKAQVPYIVDVQINVTEVPINKLKSNSFRGSSNYYKIYNSVIKNQLNNNSIVTALSDANKIKSAYASERMNENFLQELKSLDHSGLLKVPALVDSAALKKLNSITTGRHIHCALNSSENLHIDSNHTDNKNNGNKSTDYDEIMSKNLTDILSNDIVFTETETQPYELCGECGQSHENFETTPIENINNNRAEPKNSINAEQMKNLKDLSHLMKSKEEIIQSSHSVSILTLLTNLSSAQTSLSTRSVSVGYDNNTLMQSTLAKSTEKVLSSPILELNVTMNSITAESKTYHAVTGHNLTKTTCYVLFTLQKENKTNTGILVSNITSELTSTENVETRPVIPNSNQSNVSNQSASSLAITTELTPITTISNNSAISTDLKITTTSSNETYLTTNSFLSDHTSILPTNKSETQINNITVLPTVSKKNICSKQTTLELKTNHESSTANSVMNPLISNLSYILSRLSNEINNFNKTTISSNQTTISLTFAPENTFTAGADNMTTRLNTSISNINSTVNIDSNTTATTYSLDKLTNMSTIGDKSTQSNATDLSIPSNATDLSTQTNVLTSDLTTLTNTSTTNSSTLIFQETTSKGENNTSSTNMSSATIFMKTISPNMSNETKNLNPMCCPLLSNLTIHNITNILLIGSDYEKINVNVSLTTATVPTFRNTINPYFYRHEIVKPKYRRKINKKTSCLRNNFYDYKPEEDDFRIMRNNINYNRVNMQFRGCTQLLKDNHQPNYQVNDITDHKLVQNFKNNRFNKTPSLSTQMSLERKYNNVNPYEDLRKIMTSTLEEGITIKNLEQKNKLFQTTEKVALDQIELFNRISIDDNKNTFWNNKDSVRKYVVENNTYFIPYVYVDMNNENDTRLFKDLWNEKQRLLNIKNYSCSENQENLANKKLIIEKNIVSYLSKISFNPKKNISEILLKDKVYVAKLQDFNQKYSQILEFTRPFSVIKKSASPKNSKFYSTYDTQYLTSRSPLHSVTELKISQDQGIKNTISIRNLLQHPFSFIRMGTQTSEKEKFSQNFKSLSKPTTYQKILSYILPNQRMLEDLQPYIKQRRSQLPLTEEEKLILTEFLSSKNLTNLSKVRKKSYSNTTSLEKINKSITKLNINQKKIENFNIKKILERPSLQRSQNTSPKYETVTNQQKGLKLAKSLILNNNKHNHERNKILSTERTKASSLKEKIVVKSQSLVKNGKSSRTL